MYLQISILHYKSPPVSYYIPITGNSQDRKAQKLQKMQKMYIEFDIYIIYNNNGLVRR